MRFLSVEHRGIEVERAFEVLQDKALLFDEKRTKNALFNPKNTRKEAPAIPLLSGRNSGQVTG